MSKVLPKEMSRHWNCGPGRVTHAEPQVQQQPLSLRRPLLSPRASPGQGAGSSARVVGGASPPTENHLGLQ